MRRMLITGGAGFIGSHVADAALSAGYEVSVLDDLSSGRAENVPAGARLHVLDLRDHAGVRALLSELRPDVVSHHAAQVSVSRSVTAPLHDAEVNVVGTLNLLEAVRLSGCGRFVFASSGGAIHGEVPEGLRADASWPPAVISPYAAGKLAGEGYLRAYHAQFGVAFTALRYANVYGPRQNPHGEAGVVAVFAQRLLAGEPVVINAMDHAGDGGCVRDYVFVADVARANVLAAQGETPEVLNVGTGVATSTRALLDALCAAGGFTAGVAGGPVRAGDIRRSVLSPEACERLLGVMTPLATGLKVTLEAFRAEASQLEASQLEASQLEASQLEAGQMV